MASVLGTVTCGGGSSQLPADVASENAACAKIAANRLDEGPLFHGVRYFHRHRPGSFVGSRPVSGDHSSGATMKTVQTCWRRFALALLSAVTVTAGLLVAAPAAPTSAATSCANPVACENLLPGDPPANWQISG